MGFAKMDCCKYKIILYPKDENWGTVCGCGCEYIDGVDKKSFL